jgi:hypothetical protein
MKLLEKCAMDGCNGRDFANKTLARVRKFGLTAAAIVVAILAAILSVTFIDVSSAITS